MTSNPLLAIDKGETAARSLTNPLLGPFEPLPGSNIGFGKMGLAECLGCAWKVEAMRHAGSQGVKSADWAGSFQVRRLPDFRVPGKNPSCTVRLCRLALVCIFLMEAGDPRPAAGLQDASLIWVSTPAGRLRWGRPSLESGSDCRRRRRRCRATPSSPATGCAGRQSACHPETRRRGS